MLRVRASCRNRLVAALAALACAASGCGGVAPAEPTAPSPEPGPSVPDAGQGARAPLPPAPAEPEASLENYAGTYRVSGEPIEDDGCGGRLVWVAEHLVIDAQARTLFADVVDRTYDARVEGERLVAEGRFPRPRGACPESTIYGRWELDATEEGNLEGTLASVWLLSPECREPCRIRFRVTAVRGE